MSLQSAAERALEIEQEAGAWASYHDLAEAFSKAVQALDAADPRRGFLIWETWLYQYQLHRTTQPRGEDFGAFFELADGGRHPPRVRDFPGEALGYFRLRLQTVECPSARARLADFLWLRTRDVSLAESAIAAYLVASQAVHSSSAGSMVATEYLVRAAELSRGLQREAADVRVAIRQLAETLVPQGSGFLCMLVRGTASEIGADSGLSTWLLQELTRLADEAAAGGGQHRSSERGLMSAAADIAAAKQDLGLVKELRKRAARSFELEADERQADAPLIRSALLQDAMKGYADLGMSAELQRVKPKVHDTSERASADLKVVSTKIDIPMDRLREDMQKIVEAGRQRAPWGHLQILALRSLWSEWDIVAARTSDAQQKYPLQSLVRKVVLGPDGRPLPRPSDPTAARLFDEIEYYVRDTQLRLGLCLIEIEMLRDLDAWNEDLIMQALGSGLLFNAETLAAIRPGVVAYEAGRYWEAMHALVPQIERVIRELAQLFGANAYRYQSGTGEVLWSSLTMLLVLEPVKAVLTKIRPDLADQLTYLLVDSRGLNLRDNVAHGIVSNDSGTDMRALLCLLILLTLSLPHLSSGATEEPPQAP
jgi:hypothetical protein